MCKKCNIEPVYELHNKRKLCSRCFVKYFEKKAAKTISKYKLLSNKDKTIVAASGGKDSLSLLYFFVKKYSGKSKKSKESKKHKVEAILIDEGIKGYRDQTLKDLKRVCKQLNIKLHIFSFKKEFGFTLDEIVKRYIKTKKIELTPCYICGVFRRYLLNKKSMKLGFNKLATGHNLDDEAQTIIMNQLKGDSDVFLRGGPESGVLETDFFAQRIKPFYFLTEKEDLIYALLHRLNPEFIECPYLEQYQTTRREVRDFLNDFESKHPGAKNAIVNNYMRISGKIKKSKIQSIKKCKKCGEPSAKDICKACELIDKIKILSKVQNRK